MTDNQVLNMEQILTHPHVKKATDDTNEQLLERRKYSPPQCDVFLNPYTILEETDQYRFELDKEATKQLPNIIGNRVQLIKGQKSVDDDVARQYRHLAAIMSLPVFMTQPKKLIRQPRFLDFWWGLTESLIMRPSN